ncbi:hypothetical protein B0T21DRAFT_410116 [Apiosordaria backusii]|uniref:Uncharacterized protein n=1 Tax=Apiosordaria backusii TaxID=314023 RepID=A0AA40EFK6_9PEZI|nr:hypothetical protein B0T21DRAFT_410116 [Apiosordaria backusii]
MSIYNTPHVPRPVGSENAGASLIDTSSPAQGSSQEQEATLTTSHDPEPPQPPPLPSSSSEEAPDQSVTAKSRRRSFPFSFAPLLFQTNTTSSTSLAPSTAEGKPIPLGDTTTGGHHTSALQKLNSTYPSISDPRHRSAKSTDAQSTTYSQPVIVRTYSGHSPSQPGSSQSRYRRQPSHSRGVSRRVPLSASASQPTIGSSNLDIGVGSHSEISLDESNDQDLTTPHRIPQSRHKMPSSFSSKPRSSSFPIPLPWSWTRAPSPQQEEVKLPPLEAFSFKSFIKDATSPESSSGGVSGNDISADLDRIAEICARSRYSLSNQYEVHVAPHGSGSSFVSLTASGQRRGGRNGPTLQSDEENAGAGNRRRANARRKSVAYGTLETIMSSSRSSEEGGDGARTKGAGEVREEVRGRVGRRKAGSGSASGSGKTTESSHDGDDKKLARKKSASFANAIMDSSSGNHGGGGSSREEGLLSEIALPRVSGSHLGVRTGHSVQRQQQQQQQQQPASAPSQQQRRQYVEELPHEGQQNFYTHNNQNPRTSSGGSLFGSWMPWQTPPPPPPPHPSSSTPHARRNPRNAEGRLRELLRATSSEARR